MSWKSYRHRFLPWLALNWTSRQVKQCDVLSSVSKEASALSQLSQLCQELDRNLPWCTVKEWRDMEKQEGARRAQLLHTRAVMREVLGFSLKLGSSDVDKTGVGVRVTDSTPVGKLVGLYPGTVYLPFEPLFFQSLGNPFIFRCLDRYLIDGHNRGISKFIFRSCAYRDTVNHRLLCDPSWLSGNPLNPLAVGQFVNNHTRDIGPNVEYVEICVPADFPLTWRRFLPNVYYSPDMEGERLMRCVGLLTTRCVTAEEELLSSYLTVVPTGK